MGISLPRPRFVGSAAHADALKPGVSGFVRHHLFVHKGRKSQRSTRHYLNQRPWARQDLNVAVKKHDIFWLNVLGTLAGVQMRIHPSDTPECLCRRWHHVRLGPEDARDWARQVAMPITPQTMLAFYMRSWRSVLSCITIPIQPLPQNNLCVVSSGRKSPCLPIILDARVARLLAGKAVGVCFGGGGARGNVHFGVIQAMQELGIPIDVVSGTSFGALAAAMPLVLQGE